MFLNLLYYKENTVRLKKVYALLAEYEGCIKTLKGIKKALKEEFANANISEVTAGDSTVDLQRLSELRVIETEKAIAKMEKNRKELRKLAELYELASLKESQTGAGDDVKSS